MRVLVIEKRGSKNRKCIAIENAAGVGKFRFIPSKTWPRLASFESIYTKILIKNSIISVLECQITRLVYK